MSFDNMLFFTSAPPFNFPLKSVLKILICLRAADVLLRWLIKRRVKYPNFEVVSRCPGHFHLAVLENIIGLQVTPWASGGGNRGGLAPLDFEA